MTSWLELAWPGDEKAGPQNIKGKEAINLPVPLLLDTMQFSS